MAADESQKQERGDRWSKDKGRKVHFSSLMDLCHLKNSELEPQYQKYKGRVVLRGDIVKDDPGSYAVFTEGSSAFEMTAAKVMGHYIKTTWMFQGQAADARTAYTQVKMEDAPTLLKIPKSECPDIWIRLPKHKRAKIMLEYGRFSRSSRKESVRSSSGRDDYGKKPFEKVLLEYA